MQTPPIPQTPDQDGLWQILFYLAGLVIVSLAGTVAILWKKLADKDTAIAQLNHALTEQAEENAAKLEGLVREVMKAIYSRTGWRSPESDSERPKTR